MAVKPLSEEKLKYYEQLLLKEKEKTLKMITNITDKIKKGNKDSSGDLSSYSIHQADHGSDTANLETEVYFLEEEQKKILLINQALGRIYDKSYGICQITGEYISEKRLQAIPWATFSIGAREDEDNRKKKKK
ncbi:MAG: TraR/DksA C4-type zinc finger protein [Candidatus Cloacimonetes bacterium]|nr:TraR/DksA C4-type zinc finger protein [Candidatus Cloacimonadota bacterium]